MAGPPKRLFIPHKNNPKAHKNYDTDMRTIEIFNPINQITAGSGITLNPTSGEGPTVEISSSGGGSTNPGVIFLGAGSDTADYPFTTIFLGPNLDTFGPEETTYFRVFANSTGSIVYYTFGKSWFTYVNPSDSVSFLPIVGTPAFTNGGGTLGILLVMAVQSIDATNMDVESTIGSALAQAPSTTIRYPASDYSNITSTGTDISFVQGTGTSSGSGQLSVGGGSPGTLSGLYLASVQLTVGVPDGTTFP